MAFVYWIHKPEHNDVMTCGYIGVYKGSRVEDRWRRHNRDAAKGSKYPIHKAIRKYGDSLIYQMLFMGSYEECLRLEAFWRPVMQTGWNIHSGGRTCSPMQGRKHTEASKTKMSNSHKGRCRSVESLLKQSNTLKGHITTEYTKNLISKSQKGKANNGVLKARKVVKASTGETFESVCAAAKWLNIHPSNIFKQIKGVYSTAGVHPTTKERLLWEYV